MGGAPPPIIAYGARNQPFMIKVMRALHLKGLAYRVVEPEHLDDFRRFSPKTGLLPAMDLGGTRVEDSSAILDLLDAHFPEPPLLASDPKTAREQRRLEAWIGEAFLWYHMRGLRSRFGNVPTGPPADPEGPLGPAARMGLITPDGKMRPEFFEAGSWRDSGSDFERRLGDLAGFLGERPFFFSDRMSRADLAVFGFLEGFRLDLYPGSRRLLERRESLWSHTERVDRATAAPPG